jgi:8-oxo-dGTP diphosphatase
VPNQNSNEVAKLTDETDMKNINFFLNTSPIYLIRKQKVNGILIYKISYILFLIMDSEVAKVYGNKVRIRACGLCWENDRLLMVNHKGITDTDFWAPPGGGVEFGFSVEETLKKEFLEETGLKIMAGPFLFACEYLEKPIHSVELFFEVTAIGGKLKVGSDPEIQIIEAVQYIEFSKIKKLPNQEVHGIFRLTDKADNLKNLNGFYRI